MEFEQEAIELFPFNSDSMFHSTEAQLYGIRMRIAAFGRKCYAAALWKEAKAARRAGYNLAADGMEEKAAEVEAGCHAPVSLLTQELEDAKQAICHMAIEADKAFKSGALKERMLWMDWFRGLQADFLGVTDDAHDPERLHSWDFLETVDRGAPGETP